MTLDQKTLNLPIRLRRNRRSPAIRNMICETHLTPHDLVAPLFVIDGEKTKVPILSMPGVERLSIDLLIKEVKELSKMGVQSIALFPVIDPSLKTVDGKEAWNIDGLMGRAIREIKFAVPEICIIADVALDPFTTHGHDGLVNEKGEIANDETVECLIQMALMQARAGADFVAPSDMMDGRVGAIRDALDEEGFENTGILAYSAKYASALYNPFRDALKVKLEFGDKKTYQMDPANREEAIRETMMDIDEGADIVMIKPGLCYLDIVREIKNAVTVPVAVYQVSGEYAMIKAASEKGWLNHDAVMMEQLTAIKRAGANMIASYFAKDAVKLIS